MNDLVEVRPSPIHGVGCFATRPIPAGTRWVYRIVININEALAHRLNHSNDPNCETVVIDGDGRSMWIVQTIVDVDEGDEFLIRYPTSPEGAHGA